MTLDRAIAAAVLLLALAMMAWCAKGLGVLLATGGLA